MRKQELIHLHGLLEQVHDRYEEEVNAEIDMSEYEDVGVRSTSIHRSKSAHKEAVFALSQCVTEDMQEETSEPVAATAD